MGNPFTRADSLREYLSGAASDGGPQYSPNNSLGGFRSIREALSLGINIGSPVISGVSIVYAAGANPAGTGLLIADSDQQTLYWQPPGASSPGPGVIMSGSLEVLEANGDPSQYLRVLGTPPFNPGQSPITLNNLVDGVYGFRDVSLTAYTALTSEYRATIIRNESAGIVSAFQRWLRLLGTPQVSDVSQLGASGSGIITTSVGFTDWPITGWCHIQAVNGSLREVIYYSSRTLTTLTIASTGRGLLGTTPTLGQPTDSIFPVPGVAIGVDPTGIVSFGSSIQTIANVNTSPIGVTWNLGLSELTGLQLGDLGLSEQVGIWAWRQTPANIVATPLALTGYNNAFYAF